MTFARSTFLSLDALMHFPALLVCVVPSLPSGGEVPGLSSPVTSDGMEPITHPPLLDCPSLM